MSKNNKMPYVGYKTANNVKSYLISGTSASSTTAIVKDGNIFPTTFPYILIIEHYNNEGLCTAREIVKCTAKNGDILTIVRGFENCIQDDTATTKIYSSTSHNFNAGDIVTLGFTSGLIEDVKNGFNDIEADITTANDRLTALNNLVQQLEDDISNL